jgi:hypothetical protein
MCVTFLDSNQNSHNGHKGSSAPPHNLHKQWSTQINTQFITSSIDMYACMHMTKLISLNLSWVKMLH